MDRSGLVSKENMYYSIGSRKEIIGSIREKECFYNSGQRYNLSNEHSVSVVPP